MTRYDDIINLPHHTSVTHTPLPIADRAAQFSPFAALTGYEDAIDETARFTQDWIELDENEKERLNEKFQKIREQLHMHTHVIFTYFEPDQKKQGGAYLTVEGRARKLDEPKHAFIMEDGREILIERIVKVELPKV